HDSRICSEDSQPCP
ncbi:hypothetical protein BN1708_019376, partial [Verticillium longisporum]